MAWKFVKKILEIERKGKRHQPLLSAFRLGSGGLFYGEGFIEGLLCRACVQRGRWRRRRTPDLGGAIPPETLHLRQRGRQTPPPLAEGSLETKLRSAL